MEDLNMAFKYPTGKFDDPTKTVSQSGRKVYDANWNDAIRRALVGISNRVIYGTSGSGINGTALNAGCGTGATGGVGITYGVIAVINGKMGTIGIAANLEFPAGTQSAATYVKYLISSGFGSSGTVTAGNEGTGSTTALLPDCPDNHVALGYMEYAANGTRGWIRTNSVCSGDTGGTNGTVNAWKDLIHMPLNEA
jgi:hypothetical protein